MARAKKTTSKRAVSKKSVSKKSVSKKSVSKKSVSKKSVSKKSASKSRTPPKAAAAVKKAVDALWDVGVPPHTLLQEVHELLLLRSLEEAEGNYAAAAVIFGPSRQSVQQYANSPLRDARWKPFQQNKRKGR